MNRKTPDTPKVNMLDLATAARLHGVPGAEIDWQPNPCRVCSPDSKTGIPGSGVDPATGNACTACGGSGYGPQRDALISEAFEILLGGAKYGGKGTVTCGLLDGRIGGMICTPFGFRSISDLSIGSLVSNPDGSCAEVIAKHPLGERDIYEVTFIDGASTIVTADHLWLVHIVGRRTKSNQRHFPFRVEDQIGNWKIVTTLELQNRLRKAKKSTATVTPNIHIPLTEPVQFTVSAGGNPLWNDLPPYLLGVVLGDGRVDGNTLHWSKPDQEIALFVKEETGREVRRGRAKTTRNRYAVANSDDFAAAYKHAGLEGKRSWEKFIPPSYLHSPLEVRWSLVQGLMDTDGTSDDRGHCSFESTSGKLAKQMQYLCRSLGFKATLTGPHPASYRNGNGERIECRDSFSVYIQGKYADRLFRLPRKRDRIKEFHGGMCDPVRRVAGVEKAGKSDATCITVSNPNGLYLTDDFIVTHNSEGGRMWLLQGNPLLPRYIDFRSASGKGRRFPVLVNQSYIHHPRYRALVLRLNQADLKDWIDRAEPVYKKHGAVKVGSPAEFRFPSGAKILTGHMDGDDAYFKYQGQEFHRMVIEELTHIPTLSHYLRLRSCVRSTIPSLRPQLFLTTNPLGPGHCVRRGEVLTPDRGWVPIQDLRVGDAVYEVSPNCKLIRSTVGQIHRRHFHGHLWSVQHRSVFMECTPEHRVAYYPDDKGSGKFQLTSVSNLPYGALLPRIVSESGGSRIAKFRLPYADGPRVKNSNPDELLGDDYCEFMGWFLSEGYVLRSGKDGGKVFGIGQLGSRYRGIIRDLLIKCRFSFREIENGFSVYSEKWCSYLRQFGKAANKFIPRRILNSSQNQRALFFESLMAGDGHWHSEDSGEYYTQSEQLADDVQELCVRMGMRAKIHHRKWGHAMTDLYTVSFHSSPSSRIFTGQRTYKKNSKNVDKSQVVMVPYEGPVYDIGVPKHHTFLIRQDGHVWVSGNSWVMERFIQPLDENGEPIPPKTIIWEDWHDERTGDRGRISRVFIPALIDDNPAANEIYRGNLATMEEKEKRAYLYGDWNVMSGNVFWMFRPRGPLKGDPDSACHVLRAPGSTSTHAIPDAAPLMPWWERGIGGDWGYSHNCAFLIGARNPATRQLILYKEISLSRTSPVEAGVTLAEEVRADLDGLPDHSIKLWFSHEAFARSQHGREGVQSIVELISAGIAKILGPEAVHIPEYGVERFGVDPYSTYRKLTEAQSAVARHGITFMRVSTDRVLGITVMRQMMEWTAPIRLDPDALKGSKLEADIYRELGEEAASYIQRIARRAEEDGEYPRLKIWDCCRNLIAGIPKAQHQDKEKGNPEDMAKAHFSGMDELDACFPAGTPVTTPSGVVPIDSLRAGDWVLTRRGPRRVLSAGVTKHDAGIVFVLTTHGLVCGTPNHPIWTSKKGFTPLDELRYLDVLWPTNRSSTTGTGIIAQKIPHCDIAEYTSRRTGALAGKALQLCSIVKFGWTAMARFLKVITSTISTAIPSTTTLRIWSVCHQGSIAISISRQSYGRGSASTRRKSDRSQSAGMALRRVGSGTASTLWSRFAGVRNSASNASFVAGVFGPKLHSSSSAAPTVNRLSAGGLGSILRSGAAKSAEALFGVIATSLRRLVPCLVLWQLPTKRSADVYNLEVEGEHEYFAWGVLVHNCRYLCVGFRDTHQREPFSAYYERRMEEAVNRYKGDARALYHINLRLEAEERKRSEPDSITLRRVPGAAERHVELSAEETASWPF